MVLHQNLEEGNMWGRCLPVAWGGQSRVGRVQGGGWGVQVWEELDLAFLPEDLCLHFSGSSDPGQP